MHDAGAGHSAPTSETGQDGQRLRWRDRIGYGIGDYGLNFFWQGASFYLFFFYTDVLHLSNSTAGLFFAIGGLWDAASDPVVGYIAERTRSRHGRYRPYLLWGAPLLSLSFVLAFAPLVSTQPALQGLQVLLTLLAFRTAYTLVAIPYSSLSARLASNSAERTRLAGVRLYCGFLGGISVVAIAGWLRQNMADSDAFVSMAAVSAVVACAALTLCFTMTDERSQVANVGQPATTLPVLFKAVKVNQPLLVLLLGIIFVTVATTLTVKTVLYIFAYRLNNAEAGNSALFIFTAMPLATIPLWSFLALKIGKARSWQLAAVITASGLAWLYVSPSSSVLSFWLGYGWATFGLSAFGLLFWSMLPDTIEYGLVQSGVRNEAILFGLASSFQKAALALSALVLGFLLDAIGYQAGAVQSPETLDGLLGVGSLIPAVAALIAGSVMMLYRLDHNQHDALVAKLRSQADITSR